jgi:hypothetical protein
VLLVGFSAILCVYVGPAAAGSGIPEVKAYLNGVDTPNIFSLKTFFVKVRSKSIQDSACLVVNIWKYLFSILAIFSCFHVNLKSLFL